MEPITRTYFGWLRLSHSEDCRTQQWEVDYRNEDTNRLGPKGHSCPDEDCTHRDFYDRVTVRLVCRSCGRAFRISGEEHVWEGTGIKTLGYGQEPKKAGGLWLYPGEPLIRELDAEPYEYLVAATNTKQLQLQDVIGYIRRARTSRGKNYFEASAQPDLVAEHSHPFLWKARSKGQYATTTAAAKWIAAQQREEADS